MSNSILDTFKVLDSLLNTTELAVDIKRRQDEITNYNNKLANINMAKKIAEDNKRLADLSYINNLNKFKDSGANIETSLTRLEQLNITKDIARNKIEEHMQTDSFQDMIRGTGLELNDNLQFEFDTANNIVDSYSNMSKSTELNNQIYNVLDGMANEIYAVGRQYEPLVQVGEGIAGVKDIADFERTVDENPSVFKVPEYDDSGNIVIDEKGNVSYTDMDNYLATAFKTPKKNVGQGIEVGYVPTWTDAAVLGSSQGNSIGEEEMALMDINSNILKRKTASFSSSDWNLLPDKLKKRVTDLGSIQIDKDYLGEQLGYNKQFIQKELDNIFHSTVSNIDNMLSWAHDKWNFNDVAWYDELEKSNPGVFNYNYQGGGPIAGMQELLGNKGEDGILVKKGNNGRWIVDRDKLADIHSKLDLEENPAIGRQLEQHLIYAKDLQDMAFLNPWDYGGIPDKKQFDKMLEAKLQLNSGKITKEQYDDILNSLFAQ